MPWPYSAVLEGSDEWVFYGSSSVRPATLLLELLWTRLHSMALVPNDVFGEDMEVEQFNPLLYASPKRVGERLGWHYRYDDLSPAELRAAHSVATWNPVRLDNNEAALLHYLSSKVELDTATDSFWRDWCADPRNDKAATLAKLRLGGIAAIDHEGTLRLLTEQCQVAAVPELGWVAAENAGGRFTRWLLAQMEQRPRRKNQG